MTDLYGPLIEALDLGVTEDQLMSALKDKTEFEQVCFLSQ